MVSIRTCALPLFLLIALSTLGQVSSDFNVINYTSDSGLPQNSVTQIVRDKKGFLWLGTQGGVVRFDGIKFKTYNRDNTPAMGSNRIRHVGLLADSSVYFVDDNSRIFSFDQQNRPVHLGFKEWNNAIVILSNIRSYDLIKSLRTQDRKLIESTIPKNVRINFEYNEVGQLGNGFLRVADNHLFYLSGKKIIFRDSVSGPVGMIGSNLYYVNSRQQFCKIDTTGRKSIVSFSTNDTAKIHIAPGKTFFFCQQGSTLYVYSNHTVYRVIENGVNSIFCEKILSTGNISNVINYQYFSELGIHVVGSTTRGVFIFRKNQFNTIGRNIPDFDGSFASQAVFSKDAVITSNGIFSPDKTVTKGLKNLYRTIAILKDRRGNFWMCQNNGRLVQLSPDLKIIKKLPIVFANSLKETPDGNIWFASEYLGRVSGDTVQKFYMKKDLSISTFLPVSNNEFWVGHSKGLLFYNVLKRKEEHFSGMKDKEIRTLYLDKQKTLWAGTYGQGFYAVKNGRAVRLPLDKNGYLLFTHTFLEDKSGFMWMTTNHGLFKCKIQDLHDYIDKKINSVYYYYYDKDSGFGTNEFNGGCEPAGVVFPDGKFSLPSLDGLVQFYPDSIKDVMPSSSIFIDKLIVDGRELPFTSELNIPPSFDRIEIQISSPYFGNEKNQILEYNIEGLNDNWYELKEDNHISLERLEHGSYNLRVRKKVGFGKNNIKMMVQTFKVRPFWYQRWHFRFLGFLLFLGMIFGMVLLWYLYLIRRKTDLEKQVQDRTAKLLYSNRLKEKMTLLIAHDLQSPLHFLNILSEHVFQSAQNSNWSEVISGSQEIKKATLNIHSFVEEFTLWSRSQNENFNLTKESFYIDELVRELQHFYQEMLSLNNNQLAFDNMGPQIIYTNREILKAILRNLLDNANKYTRNGNIVFKIEAEDDGALILTIQDNGSGMSPSDLAKINQRIAQASNINSIEQNSRLGYQIIIDFVTRLGCKLEVISSKGSGTTVKIKGLSSGQASTFDGKSINPVRLGKLN